MASLQLQHQCFEFEVYRFLTRFWVFWMMKTTINTTMVVLVLLSRLHVSEKPIPLGIGHAMTAYAPTNRGHRDCQFVMVAALPAIPPMVIRFAIGRLYSL